MKINFESPFALMQRITTAALCVVFFMASGCGEQQPSGNGDEPLTSLAGTNWKLAGIVDKRTGKFSKLKPIDCESCYTISFDTDVEFTAISIWKRLKVDLRFYDPPSYVWDKYYPAEYYDKEDKSYIESDEFWRGVLLTDSCFATSNELTLFTHKIEGTGYNLSFIPHKGDNPSTSLRGTKWKLTGIIDVQTNEIKVLEPENCVECYTLTFIGDNIVEALSLFFRHDINLLDMDEERDPTKPKGTGPNEPPKYEETWHDIDGGDGLKYWDSYLFRCCLANSKSYELTTNELKLFYKDGEKSYYLSFKNIYK